MLRATSSSLASECCFLCNPLLSHTCNPTWIHSQIQHQPMCLRSCNFKCFHCWYFVKNDEELEHCSCQYCCYWPWVPLDWSRREDNLDPEVSLYYKVGCKWPWMFGILWNTRICSKTFIHPCAQFWVGQSCAVGKLLFHFVQTATMTGL